MSNMIQLINDVQHVQFKSVFIVYVYYSDEQGNATITLSNPFIMISSYAEGLKYSKMLSRVFWRKVLKFYHKVSLTIA